MEDTMGGSPKDAQHLLIDFFDTLDQQMAILQLKAGELFFYLPNRSVVAFFDLPADRLANTPLKAFAELDDCLQQWLRRCARGAKRPAVCTFECRLRSRRPPVWLECRVFPLPPRPDGSTFFGLVTVDITERKKAQDELGKVKDRLQDIIDLGTDELEITTESLRIILDRIPVMICCYDASAKVLFVNHAFEEVTGWGLAEARRNNILAALYPDPGDRRRALEFMMSDGTGWQDFRLRRRNGAVLETSWDHAPLTDGIRIGIGIDITQRIQAEKALRRLSRQTLEMLESDRQAVAKELHDSIGASLAAIKFALEGRVSVMGGPPAEGELPFETIIAHLADTIKESKRISNGLRPLTLDDLGLLPTLKAYVRQLKETFPHLAIAMKIGVRETDLPDPLKIVLYRVIQEALNNIHKHSGADRADLRLKRRGAAVELEVTDNGGGFAVEEILARSDPLSGYGLRGMRERVEICGGSFGIRSRKGAGTTVHARIPLG
jgi:PAS domain S-box-containing protein